MTKLPVAFLRSAEDQDAEVYAWFPTFRDDNTGWETVYERVGQHSNAHIGYIRGNSTDADPVEAAPLVAEVAQVYSDATLVYVTLDEGMSL